MPMREEKKNVIYLIADSLRPDYLSCYGADSTRTPQIDKLAEEGVRFDKVISAAPWTIPSVKSHATGKYPHDIGIFDSSQDEGPTIFNQFKEMGYQTALFYDSERRNELFPDDVDYYDWSYDLENLLDFITENKDEPFFLFNLYRGTHLPYTLKYSSEAWHRAKDNLMEELQEGEEGIEKAKYKYARSVERFSEWYVGAIVDRLKKEGILEDTILVITGDHGESWGKRFEDQSSVDLFDLHGTLMYDEVLSVPLVLYNLDVKSQEFTDLTRSVDILPTVLDSLDAEPLRNDLEGKSLLPYLEKSKEFSELVFSVTTNYDLFGEIGVKDEETASSTFTKFSVYKGEKWKYILSTDTGEKELYNLENDPEEQDNLVDKEEAIVDELDEKIRDRFEDAISGEDRSEEVKEKLRDLGYI
jgi:arylsulfatase A-like enzyme